MQKILLMLAVFAVSSAASAATIYINNVAGFYGATELEWKSGMSVQIVPGTAEVGKLLTEMAPNTGLMCEDATFYTINDIHYIFKLDKCQEPK